MRNFSRYFLLGLCLFIVSLGVTNADDLDTADSPSLKDFLSWMKKFGKKYDNDINLKQKFSRFISNHFRVIELNKMHE